MYVIGGLHIYLHFSTSLFDHDQPFPALLSSIPYTPRDMALNTSHGQFLRTKVGPGLPPVSVLLRGVNLASSSKYPSFLTSTSGSDIWSEAEQAGDDWFVGQPFKEAEFDRHLDNLASWGFNVIRLVVTWEALEPFPYVGCMISLIS